MGCMFEHAMHITCLITPSELRPCSFASYEPYRVTPTERAPVTRATSLSTACCASSSVSMSWL